MAFYLILLCIGLSLYSLYSNISNAWRIAPSNYVLLLVSIIAFIFGVIGFKDNRHWKSKTRSWLTLILSILFSLAIFYVILLSSLLSSMGVNEQIKTVSSPDENYTIDFYFYDAGASGSFGIRGELNGPLWFKKRIFLQSGTEEVTVKWESNKIVVINDQTLDLDKGDTFRY
ncbi:DUF5412 family protein [Paraliobacillus zengyii]|uniref:DUF5412 family protein n=1 Tax=Paraliobacillus zengyii TaxID=2213194 RepID=UPI001F547A2D|nr:DUF5412 family protein [Paraliobacillus zengyii]